jgi:hypothetical protein
VENSPQENSAHINSPQKRKIHRKKARYFSAKQGHKKSWKTTHKNNSPQLITAREILFQQFTAEKSKVGKFTAEQVRKQFNTDIVTFFPMVDWKCLFWVLPYKSLVSKTVFLLSTIACKL